MAAATIEIVFDGGFNDILLDYLDMQGRSSSEEAAFDDDAWDYSSSGNDSDIVREISADILRNGESIRCLGLQPASAPQPHAPRRLPSDSHSVGDAKRDNGCKCLIYDRRLHRQFWRGEVLLTRTINGDLDNMPYGLGNFTWTLSLAWCLCQRLSLTVVS